MNKRLLWFWLSVAFVVASASLSAQSQSLWNIGGFEGTLPSFWNIGSQPGGATLTWATDSSHSMGHSLKITKSATSDTAAWISDNMCDIWSQTNSKNVDIMVGAYVKTSGVNTNPTTDDQKWYIAYTFYDSAGALIGQTKLPINQSVATSTGWVADTNSPGQTILPKDSWKTIVSFVAGKNATGTVWADDFMLYGRGGAWAGQDWNTQVGVPTGWYYWLPPNGGNDGLLGNGFENTVVTSTAAHSGMNSLEFNLPAGRQVHDGYVGTKRLSFNNLGGGTISAGDMLRISVWIKASNLVPDSAANNPGTWAVGFTPLWFAKFGNNDGYNTVGPGNDYTFAFPHVTAFDWTQYTLDVQVPTGVGAKALEVRLHIYSQFVGKIYFDDLTVTKLDVPQISGIGGFEGTLPSFWNIGSQPGGATLTWATDSSHSMGHSLKITKSATSDTAAWISDNMCDIWSPTNPKNVDIMVGAYVKTSGVNTNPTTDDQKWYIAYTFYDSAGALIGQTKLPINQSVATSTGWVADTNSPGQTILPKDSWKTIVSFVAGKNATGTVWADDFILNGRGAWAGQDWNTQVGVPTGWYYWLPPNGGNDGLLNSGFENTVVTSEAAHTGMYSLKLNLPAARSVHDGYIGTKRYVFNPAPGAPIARSSVAGSHDISTLQGVLPGDKLRISVWIKASNLVPDSAAKYPGTWAVGFTPLWFAQYGNNDGYNPVGPSPDYTFAFPPVTSFDWTQYSLDVQVPTGVGAKALEVRLHVYTQFVGTIYFDDLTVTKLDVPQISGIGGFESNLPSFWNIGSQPGGATLTWATDQSHSMGHSLKITKSATSDTAAWISDNMCDIWSPTNPKNVDILVGAYVKTSGVNTSPTTDDQKWYIAYTFYDSAGALIGQTKLPINQSVATSTGWLADTNAVGQTILPKDSWKTIVSFVAGKNATGTVWADDFMLYGRGGAWAGQDWNTQVGVPTGWYYWLPPNGGNDGLLGNGFENTVVTNEASHNGQYSLKFNLPAGRSVHDGYVGTKRMPLNDSASSTIISPGDIVRLSVWIKASGLVPDSAAKYPGTWAVGFTPLWFAQYGNNDGYNPVGPSNDYTFTFPHDTAFDWTQYSLDLVVPSGVGVKALETRLHIYSQFVGTVYFDDLTVQKVGVSTAVNGVANSGPKVFELSNNYPNPFNPSTQIQFAVPRASKISLIIYNLLGQRVRTLAEGVYAAGHYTVTWDGRGEDGQTLASGVYFSRLETGSVALVKKMLMMK
jgi:hypothetical protein